MPLQPYLRRIIEGHETLSRTDAAELLQTILRGESTDLEIAALLGSLATRGPAPTEIAGFVDAMRAAAIPVPLNDLERTLLIDTCGTGADSSGTFNISTAAALVAAAAGATLAKHGNRAVTSTCGSADVLEALGIPTELEPAVAADALRTHGFAPIRDLCAKYDRVEDRHARPPRPRHPHHLPSRRPALQPRRSLRPGHGRLRPAPRPSRR